MHGFVHLKQSLKLFSNQQAIKIIKFKAQLQCNQCG